MSRYEFYLVVFISSSCRLINIHMVKYFEEVYKIMPCRSMSGQQQQGSQQRSFSQSRDIFSNQTQNQNQNREMFSGQNQSSNVSSYQQISNFSSSAQVLSKALTRAAKAHKLSKILALDKSNFSRAHQPTPRVKRLWKDARRTLCPRKVSNLLNL